MQWQDMLAEAGFSVGDAVERKKDKIHGLIVGITGEDVTLTVAEEVFAGGQCIVHGKSFLQSEWRTIKQKSDPEEITDRGSPLTNVELHKAIGRGKLLSEILELAKKHNNSQSLKLFSKPKMVVALKDFKIGKLVLPPLTPKVEVTEGSSKSTGVCVHGCHISDELASFNFFLMPCTTLPSPANSGFVMPYWLIRPTDKEDDANIEAFGNYACYRNHKQIKAGDELRLYVPKAVREPEPLKAPAAKRLRMTGKRVDA